MSKSNMQDQSPAINSLFVANINSCSYFIPHIVYYSTKQNACRVVLN